nr:toprim domain-containing protein [Rhodohalobacter sp. SW132]
MIVESSTLATRIQPMLPQHVVVIATDGFLWTPHFNQLKLKLGMRAVPEKRELRREIKQESARAVKTILATDSDPSGDFIAWSVAKNIALNRIFRAPLRAISKQSLDVLIESDTVVNWNQLHLKLQNRYILHSLWKQAYPNLDIKTAATAALFAAEFPCRSFRSPDGDRFQSDCPIVVRYGSEIKLDSESDQKHFKHNEPFSTFDATVKAFDRNGSTSYQKAQEKLYTLFTTAHPQTGEGLITYPRTDAVSFYPDTWDELYQQWIGRNRATEFLPAYLRDKLTGNGVHEAIHPVSMDADPEYINKHIPSDLGNIYAAIYDQTEKAIRMPDQAKVVFNSKSAGSFFLSENDDFKSRPEMLHPVIPREDYGKELNRYGVLRPSGFGQWLDRAISENIIQVNRWGDVHPGETILPLISEGDQFHTRILKMKEKADDPGLKIETIRQILTS